MMPMRGSLPPCCARAASGHAASFDHLVGASEQWQRNREAECPRGLEINDQLDSRFLLDRHVGWLVAPENVPGVDAPEVIQVCNSASVAHQSACRGKRTKLIDRGHRVAEREHRELFAPAVEEWIALDHEPAGSQWDQVCEGRINVASATRVQDMELPPQRAGRLLQLSRLDIATGKSRIDECGYCAPVGEQLVEQMQSLPIRFRTQRGHACEVTARSVQAGYETDLNRIGAGHKNNGDCGGFSFGRYRRLAVRDNHAHLTTKSSLVRIGTEISCRPSAGTAMISSSRKARFESLSGFHMNATRARSGT